MTGTVLKVSGLCQSRAIFANPVRDPVDDLLGTHARTAKKLIRFSGIAQQRVGRLGSLETERFAKLFAKFFRDASDTEQLWAGNVDYIWRRRSAAKRHEAHRRSVGLPNGV